MSDLRIWKLSLIIIIQFSSKRLDSLREFQQFVGCEEQRLLKHCPTRWLSIHKCLKRLVSQYEAVRSYFASNDETERKRSKVHFINNTLQDPMTLPWLHFVVHALEPFTKFNALFQVCIRLSSSTIHYFKCIIFIM